MWLFLSDRADPRLLEQGGSTCECGRCACYRCRHAATAGTFSATVHRVPRGPECIAGAFEAVRTPLESAPNAGVPMRGKMPNGMTGFYGDDRRCPSDLACRERLSFPERCVRGLRSRLPRWCALSHYVVMSVTPCR